MGEGSVKLALKMHCHGRNLKIFSAAAESGTAGYKNKIKLSFFLKNQFLAQSTLKKSFFARLSSPAAFHSTASIFQQKMT